MIIYHVPLLIHTYLRIPGPAGQTKYGSVYIERERDAEELSDRDITAPEVAARHLRDTSRILPTDGYFPLGALWFSFSFFSCSPLAPGLSYRRNSDNHIQTAGV